MSISIRAFSLKAMLLAMATAITLTACGPGVPTGNIPMPAPAASVAQAGNGFDVGDAAIGAAAGAIGGYMMGKSAGRNQAMQQAPVIVQQPTTVYRTYPQPAYRKPWYTPSPRTATTTTTTVQRAPSITQSRTYTSPSRSVTVSRRR
jgi:hypothetical protein